MKLNHLQPLAWPVALLIVGAAVALAGQASAAIDGFRWYGQIQALGELVLIFGGGLFAMKAGRLAIEALMRRRT